MASEKRPFEYPEDYGEPMAGTGKNAASDGAGARESFELRETERERRGEHERVQPGGVTPGFPATEGPQSSIGNVEHREETETPVSDEEFTQAVESLHEERAHPKKKSA